MKKIDIFNDKLKYWKEELAKAYDEKRKKHCLKMIERQEKKLKTPDNYSGY